MTLLCLAGPDAVASEFSTEIVRDGSLGSAELPLEIEGTDGVFEIGEEHGARSGANLFHSFELFNVGTGDTALFTANPELPTQNIISYVSGGTGSSIDGTLASDVPGANLYLLNPAGMIFGPNARLDLQGSFYASTADYLRFGTGERFSAGLEQPRILSAASPTAFGFLGSTPGSIAIDRSRLAVGDARTLALVGGHVELVGGPATGQPLDRSSPDLAVLEAPNGGQIEIASVASPGEVDQTLGVDAFEALGSIALSRALLDAGGDPRGSVIIRGDDLVLNESAITAAVRGFLSRSGTAIDLRLRGALELHSLELPELDALESRGIAQIVASSGFEAAPSTAFADAGDIRIQADGILLRGPSDISSRVFGDGAGGDITIESRTLRLDGAPGPLIGAQVHGSGAGGDVSIATQSLEILGTGSFVSTATFDSGPPGDIEIRADTLRAEGGGSLFTGIASSVEIPDDLRVVLNGDPDGGDIRITAGAVKLLGGAQIKTSVLRGRGSAGDILVDAESIEISGTASSGAPSGMFSASDFRILESGGLIFARGDAGSIRIRGPGGESPARSLAVTQGGQITTFSVGTGRAGSVDVSADRIRLAGPSDPGPDSVTGIDALAGVSASGGGEIHVAAGTLELVDGARIQARTSGPAQGGSIEVVADRIAISGRDLASRSAGIFSDVFEFSRIPARGAGGTIHIEANELTLQQGGEVSARSESQGRAGNIDVEARALHLYGGSITTSAVNGARTPEDRPGSISIRVADTLLLEGRSSINASVVNDRGGNIEIGHPDALVLLDESSILARATSPATGVGGSIRIASKIAPLRAPGTLISAEGGVAGDEGTVVISAPETDALTGVMRLSTQVLDPSTLLRASCAARASVERQGSFVVARRRGLPTSPEHLLLAFRAAEGEPGRAAPAGGGGLPSVSAAPAGGIQEAQVASLQGAGAFRGGRLQEARKRWGEASVLYARSGDLGARGDALRGLAESQQALGEYEEALEPLRRALGLAEESGDPARIAAALGSLGNSQLALGEPGAAQELFERALAAAERTGDAELAAALWMNFGNLRSVQHEPERALEAYERGAKAARSSGLHLREAQALANVARASLEAGRGEVAAAVLARVRALAQPLAASRAKAELLVHVAKTYEGLAESAPVQRQTGLLGAHEVLLAAIELGEALGEPRIRSYAYGNLGALYRLENRSDEALHLTRLALQAAEAADLSELAYRWHWQEGRLLWAEGDASGAVAAYRRAVSILEETRQETAYQYGSAEQHFRGLVAPVYLELVDALLQSSDRARDGAQSNRLLVEARATVEQLKTAELRDYFRDDCVADLEAQAVDLDAVVERGARAAAVYPIPLADRLELLVSLPEGLRRFSVSVASAEVERETQALRRSLMNPNSQEYLGPARRLYDWLVRPYEAQLKAGGIDTLVFVPGGVLRTIPPAALHDGDGFLIERYAIAVSPSLSLLAPEPLDLARARLLLGGLSQSTQGFPALSEVPRELAAVQSLYGGEILLDQEFSSARIETALAELQPTIMHVASHAQFTGDPATSFLLTYDGRMDLDDLGALVGRARFREQPLELLTLSACDTAAGDERAALGLAGVGVRAGARSALGSLWSVHDDAAYELMVAFYRQLRDGTTSKAVGLQRAQRMLLAHARFRHPAYWSPFLMISNWL